MNATVHAPTNTWQLQLSFGGNWYSTSQPFHSFHAAWTALTQLHTNHVDNPVACRIVHEFT